ncbi:MAG: hypothetical protein MUP97_04405 [Acidimicrobiia bacterium]|nr:hypothetical protein [Acidimicrobiia bacterium]
MNRGVLFLAHVQARRRWRGLVVLMIFVGLAGGLAISLVAGARRSSSVVDRYLANARQYDLAVNDPSSSTTQRQVLAIPGVVRADPYTYVGLALTSPAGAGRMIGAINGTAVDWSALDPTTRLLSGSIPDGTDPSEVVVNQAFVQEFGLSVGDTVPVRAFGLEQLDKISNGVYEPTGPRYRFHIIGVARGAQDIGIDEFHQLGNSGYGSTSQMRLSSDFYEAHRDEFLNFGAGYQIQLRDGTRGRKHLVEALRARTPAGVDPLQIYPAPPTVKRASLETPVQLETTALLALGIGIALAAAFGVALMLRAEQRAHDGDTPTFRALGCTAPQLGAAAAVRALPAALGGTVIALGVALGLSGRYPIGIGRQLELQGGFQVNVAVLGVGALGIVVFMLGCSFLFGRPRRARDLAPSTRATFAAWLGRVGAPTDLTLGAYLAFARSRRTRSVPSRQAIAAGAAVLAIVTALGVYVASVDHLYSVPEAHGWQWDAAIGNLNFPLSDTTATRLANDPRVRAHTKARYGVASVDGKSAGFLAFDAKGDAPPDLVAGRLPRTASEVALGAAALDGLGVHIGSTVTFSVKNGEFDLGGPTKPRRMRVVGQSLAPVFGELDIGHDGIITLDGIKAAGGDVTPRLVLARLRSGDATRGLTALDHDYTEEIATDLVPAQIVNLHRVRQLPLLGLAVAALMGIFVLVYTMAVSVRARTLDLAVFRALGLPARRLRRVLGWEGTVLAAAMVLIGVPAGLLLGSLLWRRVTDQLGVHGGAVVPLLLALLVPLALLTAVGASMYPARRARREKVAALLRTE